MPPIEDFYFELEPVCKCRCSIREHMYAENGVCACGCPEFRSALPDRPGEEPGVSMAS